MSDTPRTDAALLAAGYNCEKEVSALYDHGCRLERELAAAKQVQFDVEKVRRLLREVMDWHADPDNESYSECEKIMCGWCEQAADILAKLGERK